MPGKRRGREPGREWSEGGTEHEQSKKNNTQTTGVKICPVTQQQWTNRINYSGEEEGGPKQTGQTTSRLISSGGPGSPSRQGQERSTVGKKLCG